MFDLMFLVIAHGGIAVVALNRWDAIKIRKATPVAVALFFVSTYLLIKLVAAYNGIKF